MTHGLPIIRIIVLLLTLTPFLQAERERLKNVVQLKEGNLSVIQQPFPLFSFGQTIMDKHDALVYNYTDVYQARHSQEIDVTPSFLYGITDDLALFIEVPVVTKAKETHHRSSGIADLVAQLEYAFWTHATLTATNQATILSSIAVPSGSARKTPPTGFGSPSFFLGATVAHVATKWYAFTSYGALLPTRHCGIKPGDQFLYQAGVGRNIGTLPGWSFLWLIEFNGIYTRRNKNCTACEPNTGGNEIYIAPSLFIATDTFIAQIGISGAVSQRLHGVQDNNRYHVSAGIGYKVH